MSPQPAITRVRLQAQDSFDLIRLLARSQNDPRKAVGELVQNALDAGARRIDITWFNEKGARALRIGDDGAGIFPDLSREEALQRIAKTIGHSHKRALSPAQRRELMLLGKYGIGLLGFWAVGRILEIRSRVGGGDPLCLRLIEDEPNGELFRPRARLDDPDTSTEVTIRAVHEGAARQIRPVRLQAYLASELRGQLLGRDVAIEIHDRVARGMAVKDFVVRAQAFLGRRLEDLTILSVPGHEDARLELYLVAPEEERQGRVALSCGRNGYWVPDEDVDYAQTFLQVIAAETAGGAAINFTDLVTSDDPSYLQVQRVFGNGTGAAGVVYGCSRVFELAEMGTPKWAFNLSTGTDYLSTNADQHYYTTELVTSAIISASNCFPTDFRVNYYFAENVGEVIYLELPLPPMPAGRTPQVVSSSSTFVFVSGGKSAVLALNDQFPLAFSHNLSNPTPPYRLYVKMTAQDKATPIISPEVDGTETTVRFQVKP
ncbi:MAG: hypothetical protein EYC70_01175 [Planctomycetota bacterium]|nr:MAG: hypothetical protein EYC70_01175 [Planctomycetota bacterium]